MKLGPRIRKFRILAGLTQQELADRIKSSRAAISLYESDDREPDLQTLKRIASAVGISLADLHGASDSERLPEETIAFARLLEALPDDKRAAVMSFVRDALLKKK
jgi:transcriptional regulator with XRE-family HTH domain